MRLNLRTTIWGWRELIWLSTATHTSSITSLHVGLHICKASCWLWWNIMCLIFIWWLISGISELTTAPQFFVHFVMYNYFTTFVTFVLSIYSFGVRILSMIQVVVLHWRKLFSGTRTGISWGQRRSLLRKECTLDSFCTVERRVSFSL